MELTVKDGSKKKVIKEIKVDLDKCIGCRACEMACSAFHANPKYSSNNPARSRIRMVVDEQKDVYVPVRAADYSKAECMGRGTYVIDEKEYGECVFCRASCPSRDAFKEPDSGLPLKCDMCEDDQPQKEPLCVQVCRAGALAYVEREEEAGIEETAPPDEVEVGLESLIGKYGLGNVEDAVARMSKKGEAAQAKEED
jgi:benzoyl-CoA reductase subunit BamC